MALYSLENAQQQLGELIKQAQEGQLILIVDHDERVIQLVPVEKTSPKRLAESAHHQIVMADNLMPHW
jgi:prevent-host-death family protein